MSNAKRVQSVRDNWGHALRWEVTLGAMTVPLFAWSVLGRDWHVAAFATCRTRGRLYCWRTARTQSSVGCSGRVDCGTKVPRGLKSAFR